MTPSKILRGTKDNPIPQKNGTENFKLKIIARAFLSYKLLLLLGVKSIVIQDPHTTLPNKQVVNRVYVCSGVTVRRMKFVGGRMW